MSVSRAKGRKAQLPLAFVMRTEQRGLLGSPLGQWRVRLAQGVLAWLGLGCCGWAEVSVWSYAGLALHLPCSGVAHALGRQGRMSLRCVAMRSCLPSAPLCYLRLDDAHTQLSVHVDGARHRRGGVGGRAVLQTGPPSALSPSPPLPLYTFTPRTLPQ